MQAHKFAKKILKRKKVAKAEEPPPPKDESGGVFLEPMPVLDTVSVPHPPVPFSMSPRRRFARATTWSCWLLGAQLMEKMWLCTTEHQAPVTAMTLMAPMLMTGDAEGIVIQAGLVWRATHRVCASHGRELAECCVQQPHVALICVGPPNKGFV